MKPEQSSLYRRHTKLFESWEPFFPFLPLCHLHSVFAVSLSFAQHTIIFTAWNPCANNTCQLVCTRARTDASKAETSPLFVVVENVTSALSWGLVQESPQNAFGEARRMTGLRSVEAPEKFTGQSCFWQERYRKDDATRKSNRLHLRKTESNC